MLQFVNNALYMYTTHGAALRTIIGVPQTGHDCRYRALRGLHCSLGRGGEPGRAGPTYRAVCTIRGTAAEGEMADSELGALRSRLSCFEDTSESD